MAMTQAQRANRFSRSIENNRGVDDWLGDGARMNHPSDWIRLKGIPEEGGTFSILYEYEKGNSDSMPADWSVTLAPGERKTIYQKENQGAQEGVWYNVVVQYEGPYDSTLAQVPDPEGIEDGEPPMPDQVAAPAPRPVLTALAQRFPFFQRFMGGLP